MSASPPPEPRKLGRYALYDEIGAGGMATVHLGRLLGDGGFARTVAIKRLYPHLAKDPDFVAMFLDEARLAARIKHPNVVQTLDVVSTDGELFLVLDYVQGESLSQLFRAGPPPPRVLASVMAGVLHGLHAAHEATSERGEPLLLVHRDVSPPNVLVGVDGVARVLDFGIAKALGRAHTTQDGHVKGKLAYMAPEQLGGNATRQSDVFAAAVVLWEGLTGEPLFRGADEGETVSRVLSAPIESPSTRKPDLDPALVEVTMRGLARDVTKRFATAREMALALEASTPLASPSEVGAWVEETAAETITARARRVPAGEGAPVASAEAKPDPEAIADAGIAAPTAAMSAAPVTPRAGLGRARPRSGAPSPAGSKAHCDPPYKLGPNGEKIWIRECF